MTTIQVLNVVKEYINKHLKSYNVNGIDDPTSLWECHILSGKHKNSHPDYFLNLNGDTVDAYEEFEGDSDLFYDTKAPCLAERYYLRIIYKGPRSDQCKIKIISEGVNLNWWLGSMSPSTAIDYSVSLNEDSRRLGFNGVTANGDFIYGQMINGNRTMDPDAQGFNSFYGGEEVVADPIEGRADLEKPSQIYFLAPEYYTGSLDEWSEWAKYPYFEWSGERVVPLYSMAMHNFLAEVPNFFLKNESLTTFASKPQHQFKAMEAGKTYYMDVALQLSEGDLATNNGFAMTLSPNNGTQCGNVRFLPDALTTNGRYYGPSFMYKDAQDYTSIGQMIADPAQAPYTPPYFYGRAVTRLSFKCEETRVYRLSEILNGVEVLNLNREARDLFLSSNGSLQSPAFSSMMTISSSVNLFGKTRDKIITSDVTSTTDGKFVSTDATDSENSSYDRWVISSKFETPVLNFKNKEHISLLDCSEENGSSQSPVGDPVFGRGTGMWAGYGSSPKSDEGIFLSLEESFKQRKDWATPLFENTGSLADVCGFETQQSRIGELADEKDISEALVMIPFLDQPNRRGAPTITIGGNYRNFFKISKKLYNLTKHNIELGDTEPAIKAGEYKAEKGIQETSISRMIKLMKKYNIPPEFDFVTYPPKSGQFPFVMYIHEFHHTLDREDLSNIWQGVMPKIARIAEKDSSVISHDLGPVDFFEGKKMPTGIRWMVFKVKKKAETNYWKKTADSSDDDRFRFNFNVGKKEPEYSFNWPYDFFSLVELAQIEGGVHILSEEVLKTIHEPLIRVEDDDTDETVAASQQGVNSVADIPNSIFGWDDD